MGAVLREGGSAVLGEGAGCYTWGGWWVLYLGRVLGPVLGEGSGAMFGKGAGCCTHFQLCCWGLVSLDTVPVL